MVFACPSSCNSISILIRFYSFRLKLFTLRNLDTQYYEARIPEEFIKDVKVGMEALVIPLADKSREYQGSIVYIGKKAQVRNGETNVPVEIEQEDGFLIPDFNVDVEIPY